MKSLSLLVFLFLLCLVGCSGGQASLVGKYKSEIKMPESAKDDPMAKMAEGMMGFFQFDLELKEESKFTMTVMGMPIEGDWALSGKQITLTPKTFMGLNSEEMKKEGAKNGGTMAKSGDMDKPFKLEIQSDGKTLKAIDDMGGQKVPGELLFVKQS